MKQLAIIVQTRNPRINRYVKIDRVNGKILSIKKTAGPYKNVQIIRKKRTKKESFIPKAPTKKELNAAKKKIAKTADRMRKGLIQL